MRKGHGVIECILVVFSPMLTLQEIPNVTNINRIQIFEFVTSALAIGLTETWALVTRALPGGDFPID